MKQLVMTPAGLGAVRFHISPVNQMGGLIRLAASGAWHPQYSRLARRVRPLLRNPRLEILADLAPPQGVGSLPIVHLRPEAGARTWDEELGAIESLPQHVIERDLSQSGRSGPALARAVERGSVGPEVASALSLLWREVLADDWAPIERGLRAEVARCGDLMATHGMGIAMSNLHHRLHWVTGPDGASLVIDKRIHGRHDVGAEGLVLMPNAFLWDEPLVTVNAHTEGLLYPCHSADGLRSDQPAKGRRSPMAQLIGTTRARVLDALAVPLTTTSLSAELDLAPSTVSNHLKVLHTAGLVVRRREGQRVLYARTAP